MARNRVTCVHTMAEIRWYKTANKRVSQTGPLEETPIQLVSQDISRDVWWKDQFLDWEYRMVPVAAIVGGFIQYPLPASVDPSSSKFRIIQIPRRVFSGG